MASFDHKPEAYDPPYLLAGDGLGPSDPFQIPGTDWGIQPQFTPWMDDPSPYTPAPQQPQVPGGDPPAPNPFKGMFDPPQLGPVPENPFTPEAQQKIKEREAERARAQAEQKAFMKELEDAAKKKPVEDKGDFPEHQGDSWEA
jgi:hypothetical protein